MRALNRSKRHVLGPGYIFALFSVTQELYRVSESIGSFGSARASDTVMPTAFVTSECCRAIMGLSRMCLRTADLLRHCQELLDYCDHLGQLEKKAPKSWLAQEVRRIALSKYISMRESIDASKSEERR